MVDDSKGPELERDSARQDAADLRALLNALPLATVVKDREGRFLYANAAASAGYGRAPEAMVGATEQQLLPPGNHLESMLAADHEVIDSGRSLTVPGLRFRTHDGRPMVLHMRREPSKTKPVSVAPMRGGRILIIDDEAVVRETAAAILEAQGHTILASADGETALEAAKGAGVIDVVVLDLTIPGSSAEETHRRLRALLPGAGILLTSGYSEPSVLSKPSEDPRTRFLQKPFSADGLASQVRELIP